MYVFQMAVSKNETFSFLDSEGIIMFLGTKQSEQLSDLHDTVPRHILPQDIIMCHYYALLQ
jgi:hypothetical protein